MPSTMTMKRRKVTPELAAKWLEKNNNRRLRMPRVEEMARDMLNGQWRDTHQAIAFNCDGSLKDGQHRLHAVVKSGVPQVFWIATGLSDEAGVHIDTHAPRSDCDAFQLAGAEAGTAIVCCAKQMYAGPSCRFNRRMLSREDLLAFINKHQAALAFVCAGKHVKGVTLAAPRSIIARAYYHTPKDRLARFRDLLFNGVDDDFRAIESAPIKLRDWLLTSHSSIHVDAACEAAQRTQTALQAFMEGRKLTIVRPTQGNMYPLKTDKKEVAA